MGQEICVILNASDRARLDAIAVDRNQPHKHAQRAHQIRRAIEESGDLRLPEAERRHALNRAFFAPGNDPGAWLEGWYPAPMHAEQAAERVTPVDEWFAGGHASILLVQSAQDTVTPESQDSVLRDMLGPRVSVVIPHAGHALAPEQPAALARAIAAFAHQH